MEKCFLFFVLFFELHRCTQVLTWSGEHFSAGFASLRGFLQEHQGADSEREAFRCRA